MRYAALYYYTNKATVAVVTTSDVRSGTLTTSDALSATLTASIAAGGPS